MIGHFAACTMGPSRPESVSHIRNTQSPALFRITVGEGDFPPFIISRPSDPDGATKTVRIGKT